MFVKSENILLALSPTDLFQHFNSEFVRLERESGFYLSTDGIVFKVDSFNHEIMISYNTNAGYSDILIEVVRKYLSFNIGIRVTIDKFDTRYIRNHPYNTFISVNVFNLLRTTYRDYQYWLLLGNEPRHLTCSRSSITNYILKSTIYLRLTGIGYVEYVPDQILFLSGKLSNFNHNMISYSEDDGVVLEAFYRYNFCKSTKSARKL